MIRVDIGWAVEAEVDPELMALEVEVGVESSSESSSEAEEASVSVALAGAPVALEATAVIVELASVELVSSEATSAETKAIVATGKALKGRVELSGQDLMNGAANE